MAGISLRNVKKSFGQHVAVANFDLEVADGQFVVLLGPSGCGKTTTLNCIAGLEKPTEGAIKFGDTDVTELPPHARNIAMVFQSALLYPHLSARANIELSLRRSGMSASEIQERVTQSVEMLGVDHLLDKKPSQLSGGERQRVALAKAIVREPSVFLMDEPFSALDAALRNSLRAELVHLQKTLNVTTIFVTHDQVEAMTMGDLIVVMNEGRIEQVGTPNEIYNNPRTRFVAGFIGSPPMNFFDGELSAGDGELLFQSHGVTLKLPEDQQSEAVSNEGTVTLGVRPQHMEIVAEATPTAIPMEVYAVEQLGKETVVILKASDESVYRVLTSPDFVCRTGEALFVTPNLSNAHLFPGSAT